MKNRFMIFAAAAAVLLLTASISDASAYFTTYVTGRGEKEVVIKDRTTIEEPTFENFMKTVKITADENSEPVYVRARAFAPADFGVVYADPSGKWSFGDDGWCYYADPICGAGSDFAEEFSDSAKEFNVKIGTLIENSSPLDLPEGVIGRDPALGTLYNIPGTGNDGDNFNVIVVYEYTPVLYKEDTDGKLKPYADWNKNVEHMNSGTSGESGGEGTETGGGNG